MATCRRCGANVEAQAAFCPSCGLPKAVVCPACSKQYQVGPEHFRGSTHFEFKCPNCQTLVIATNPIAQVSPPVAPAPMPPVQAPESRGPAVPIAQTQQTAAARFETPPSTGFPPKKKLGLLPKVGIGCGGLIVLMILLGIVGALLGHSSGNDSGTGSAASSGENNNGGFVALFTMTVGNSQLVPLLAGIGESGEIKISTDRGVVMYNRAALAQTIGGGRELRIPLSQEFTIQAYNGDSSGNFQLHLTIYDKSGNKKYSNVAGSGEMLNVSQDDL